MAGVSSLFRGSITAIALVWGAPTHASVPAPCSTEMYRQADKMLPAASRTWPALIKHQQTFGACDDGALAAGYSNAVTILFGRDWRQYIRLSKKRAVPAPFTRWAISHIDATAAPADLQRIVSNTGPCNDMAEKYICQQVRQAALAALRAGVVQN